MTKHVLMIFPTLHEARDYYALTRICGGNICVMLLRLRTAMVSAFYLTTIVLVFSLTTLEEHR